MHKTKKYGTPYDDAFKTMLEKFPQLIIPIINEQFNKNYALNETVEFLNTEMHEAKEQKVLADSVFRICRDFYHVECQSNPDNTIAVRILEYDFFVSNLFILLPFYIMRYEAEAEEFNYNSEKLHLLIDEYKDIVNRMNEAFCVENDAEGQRLCVELQVIMKKVSEYFFRNQETVKSQIGGILMGGTCWKTLEEYREAVKELN